ncbi:MAG: DUF488 domain-containing protein [Thermodesulfobacteriota bacterium]
MTRDRSEKTGCPVVTIGHSTRTLEVFVLLLKTYDVRQVIDVRTVPRSRHNPQFNHDSLPIDLKAADIGYLHMPGLGGLRRAHRDSINLGWRNASFRGFADYMRTPEFENHLNELVKLAQDKRIALMCAEALPWRCHRSLISDALEVREIKVAHILSATHLQPHRITPFARWDGKFLIYPAEETSVQ